MSESQKVVMSVPPKKLSDWFYPNDDLKLQEMNVWCFDFETASGILASLQADDPNLEILPIKF